MQLKPIYSLATDTAQFSYINMKYWFSSIGAIASAEGIANLVGVREMQHAFYKCASLVGGNGTAYSSSQAGYQYFRIDRSRQVGI